jgi:hypothetical protein
MLYPLSYGSSERFSTSPPFKHACSNPNETHVLGPPFRKSELLGA